MSTSINPPRWRPTLILARGSEGRLPILSDPNPTCSRSLTSPNHTPNRSRPHQPASDPASCRQSRSRSFVSVSSSHTVLRTLAPPEPFVAPASSASRRQPSTPGARRVEGGGGRGAREGRDVATREHPGTCEQWSLRSHSARSHGRHGRHGLHAPLGSLSATATITSDPSSRLNRDIMSCFSAPCVCPALSS